MIIAVDLRALSAGNHSGVEIYINSLIKHLLSIDGQNKYIFYINSFRNTEVAKEIRVKFPDALIIQTKLPNKLFNLSLAQFRYPKLDRLICKKCKLQPDIFFVPDLRPTPLSKKCKKVITIHDLAYRHFPFFFSLKSRIWYKYINPEREIKEADHLISISNYTKSDLCKTYGIPHEKSTVVQQGIDETFASELNAEYLHRIRSKYNLPQKYFLFFATLEPRKNIHNLLKAFKEFQLNHHEFNLLVCGGSNSRIFKTMDLPNNPGVVTTGFVPEQDKAGIFALAEALIYPSLFEGFGLPLLEAMKCQTPIITSNTSSMPEVVRDSALLVDPKSPDSIKKAMDQITDPLTKEYLRPKMSKRIKLFSWRFTAINTLKVFKTIYHAECNRGRK